MRRAVVQNRRDTLWQRMLVGDRGEEGVRRKHRSDAEDAREVRIAHRVLRLHEEGHLLHVCNSSLRFTQLRNVCYRNYRRTRSYLSES